jgi:hypothetical protein
MNRLFVLAAAFAASLGLASTAHAQVVAYHTTTSLNAVPISSGPTSPKLLVPDGTYLVLATMDIDNDDPNPQGGNCQLYAYEGLSPKPPPSVPPKDDHAVRLPPSGLKSADNESVALSAVVPLHSGKRGNNNTIGVVFANFSPSVQVRSIRLTAIKVDNVIFE